MSTESQERQVLLAIKAFQSDPDLSLRRAAEIYEVPRTTVRHRIKGMAAKSDSWSGLAVLTVSEENVIIQYISQLDFRRFSPSKADVGDIANLLLTKRGTRRVGKN